jgi:hypothetical protein
MRWTRQVAQFEELRFALIILVETPRKEKTLEPQLGREHNVKYRFRLTCTQTRSTTHNKTEHNPPTQIHVCIERTHIHLIT